MTHGCAPRVTAPHIPSREAGRPGHDSRLCATRDGSAHSLPREAGEGREGAELTQLPCAPHRCILVVYLKKNRRPERFSLLAL